jgi:N-acetylglucosaminyldiphosphoundecaprenol N-acetyl-beta-D-mannosaminyltransferase
MGKSGIHVPVAIADVTVHPVLFSEAVAWIADRAASASGGVVVTPNADHVVLAREDLRFRAAILAADLRVPDGMAIVYAARLASRRLSHSVTGRLLVPAVAERAAAEGWPIALYGAEPGVADKVGAVLMRRFPGLDVRHAISPPMGLEVGSAADSKALSPLKSSGARVIFVALGAPRQEKWMDHHRADLPGSVLVGVGDAFDIIAGRFREAPRWMTRVGLEWLFRLAQEPRRLAPRYLIRDPWIFLWALRARLEAAE